MSIEVELTCPYGHTCEEARDGKIYRCAFYQEYGKSDHKGQFIEDSKYRACCIPMESVHLTELRKHMLGVQQAVESRMNTLISIVDKPQIRKVITDERYQVDERLEQAPPNGTQRLRGPRGKDINAQLHEENCATEER